jgi:hypothetical protein
MADIVNFNDRKKQKARAEKEAKAAANRAKFGRTKAEKQREEKERSADIRRLDGAKRETSEDAD